MPLRAADTAMAGAYAAMLLRRCRCCRRLLLRVTLYDAYHAALLRYMSRDDVDAARCRADMATRALPDSADV